MLRWIQDCSVLAGRAEAVRGMSGQACACMCGQNATLNRALDCPQKSGHIACSNDLSGVPACLSKGMRIQAVPGKSACTRCQDWTGSDH